MGMVPDFSKIGQRFGMLVVASYEGNGKWKCKCDCGKETIAMAYQLKAGLKKDCSCQWAKKRIKHGLARTPEENVRVMMLQRCYNQKHDSYPDYGGRGIVVCERWKGPDGLPNFVADMGRRPSKKYKIDRIDNDGPYSPENCRWATEAQQQRNTSRNVNLTWDGRTMCAKDWAKEKGISYQTLLYRVVKWGIERAMTEVIRRKVPVGFIDHQALAKSKTS